MTPRTALLLLVLGLLAAGCIRVRLTPSATATAPPATPTPSATAPAAALALGLPDVATLAPSPTAPPKRYTVQPGDTLVGIAQRHGVTVEEIVKASRLRDRDSLAVGDTLLIPSNEPAATAQPGGSSATPTPAGRRYTVQAGDTVVALAQRFGVSTAEIIKASKLSNPDRLAVGDALIIPEASGASSAAARSERDARDDTAAAPQPTRSAPGQQAGPAVSPQQPERRAVPTPTPGRRYTVKDGDTLWDIAARHGVSPAALQAANPGVSPERLRVGQALIVP